jgi:hypothetical protein
MEHARRVELMGFEPTTFPMQIGTLHLIGDSVFNGACQKSGADGIRTHYLLTASQTLSQLSYSPT